MRPELQEYIDLIIQIRVLSSVQIPEGSNSHDYRDLLTTQYNEVGKLGKRSREIMDNIIYPFLYSEEKCSYEEIIEFQDFCKALLEPESGDEVDLSLLFELSKRLLTSLIDTRYHDLLVMQLRIHISVCYANMNRTTRLTASKELCGYYKEEGLKAASELKKYLSKDLFPLISSESKTYVLRGIRFYSALYDTFYTDSESNEKRFQALKDAISLYNDPFYRQNAPAYDWNGHIFRCFEHMGQLTERGNRWHFTTEQCKEIYENQKKLCALWDMNPDESSKTLPRVHLELLLLRNRYFAEEISAAEYKNLLLDLYEKWSNNSYDMYSVQANLLIPAEYMATLEAGRITAKEAEHLEAIYEQIVKYVEGSANKDAFNYLQEYLTAIFENYIEVIGGISYRTMGLRCLAALHPPTYVHSLQVARMSAVIAEALIIKNPELFDSDGTELSRQKILNQVYNSALCHDFGKLTAIDTVFVYGRKLFDSEFDIIKLHPQMGAKMLERYASTNQYAKQALLHHVWYNGEKGYPITPGLKPDICSSIITVADCLDAATDTVGRSYNIGKTLDDVIEELKTESGTRYNPLVIDVLSDRAVLDNLNYFVNDGRSNAYEKVYKLLS